MTTLYTRIWQMVERCKSIDACLDVHSDFLLHAHFYKEQHQCQYIGSTEHITQRLKFGLSCDPARRVFLPLRSRQSASCIQKQIFWSWLGQPPSASSPAKSSHLGKTLPSRYFFPSAGCTSAPLRRPCTYRQVPTHQ